MSKRGDSKNEGSTSASKAKNTSSKKDGRKTTNSNAREKSNEPNNKQSVLDVFDGEATVDSRADGGDSAKKQKRETSN